MTTMEGRNMNNNQTYNEILGMIGTMQAILDRYSDADRDELSAEMFLDNIESALEDLLSSIVDLDYVDSF